MITIDKTTFRIDTRSTTYIFQKTKYGHLEHIYYGSLLSKEDSASSLRQKRTIQVGSSVLYDKRDNTYGLDSLCLEWSDNGRGDYRQSPTEFKMPDGSFVTDFIYASYEVFTDQPLWILYRRLMEGMKLLRSL